VLDHLLIERRPQVVRHAAGGVPVVLLAAAVALAAALGGIKGLVHSDDDVGNGDVVRTAREAVAAARATHAFHDLVAAQFAKQLLKVRQRNLLALADASQRDRALLLAQRQVN